MGILADVNLLQRDGKEYIEIKVNPSSYPVNYQGEYHIRININGCSVFILLYTSSRNAMPPFSMLL